jgi:hypothetical protein
VLGCEDRLHDRERLGRVAADDDRLVLRGVREEGRRDVDARLGRRANDARDPVDRARHRADHERRDHDAEVDAVEDLEQLEAVERARDVLVAEVGDHRADDGQGVEPRDDRDAHLPDLRDPLLLLLTGRVCEDAWRRLDDQRPEQAEEREREDEDHREAHRGEEVPQALERGVDAIHERSPGHGVRLRGDRRERPGSNLVGHVRRPPTGPAATRGSRAGRACW